MGRQLVRALAVCLAACVPALMVGCRSDSGGGDGAAQQPSEEMKSNGVSSHARTPTPNPLAKPTTVGSKAGG